MVTLKEIAQRCNVSTTTVSNVLNGKAKMSEESRKRILAVIEETGYQTNYIAKGLRTQKTQIIGIIADDITMNASSEIISSIMEECEQKGYHTMIQNLRFYSRWGTAWKDGEESYTAALHAAFRELAAIKVDGIIFVASHARVINSFPKELPVPVVMAYGYTDTAQIPCVVVDDERAGYEMTEYLLSMGHRRIGVISGRADNIHAQKRVRGYQRALFDHGVPCNLDWIRYGEWGGWLGYEMAGGLIDGGVTALFCLTDAMAFGAYRYLAEAGLRPGEDISVAGFNDENEWAELMRPGLTTMRLPFEKIGKETIGILMDALREEPGEQMPGKKTEIAVPCAFVQRDSVKRI